MVEIGGTKSNSMCSQNLENRIRIIIYSEINLGNSVHDCIIIIARYVYLLQIINTSMLQLTAQSP